MKRKHSASLKILLTADPGLPVPPKGYGGIERIVAGLAEAYRTQGHEVALVADADSTATVSKLFPWPENPRQNFPSQFRQSNTLVGAVREFGPEVVHSFSRLAYLLRLLPDRKRVTVMSYQRHTGGLGLSIAARLGGRTFSFTGCSEFICRQGRPRGGAWHSIPNFVDAARIPFQNRVPDNAPLLFLGRIEEIKGPHLAIEIARASGRPLILAGNRIESASGRAFWDQRIAPAIATKSATWVGEVDDARKWDLLGSAAGLLAPIQWDEPFGIVFVEALAAGVPVITCARGAAPEIIDNGRTGFFITNSIDGAEAVHRLPSIDRVLCRKQVLERFDQSVVASRYLSLFESIRSGAKL